MEAIEQNDIRLKIKCSPDNVFTRSGCKVDVVDLNARLNRDMIYGYVDKGGKKIPHYWFSNGRFRMLSESNLDLVVKI